MIIIEKIARKIKEQKCRRLSQRYPLKIYSKGIITIYHDYERHYHDENICKYSDVGLKQILEIEEQYKIKSCFNIVGKLIDDVPEKVLQLIENGHDIASHSYEHKIYYKMNKNEIEYDIKQTKILFGKLGKKLNGIRSPQTRWSMKQIKLMLLNNLKWSAEKDCAPHPYIIEKNQYNSLVRFPILADDWDFEEYNIDGRKYEINICKIIKEIEEKRMYGAFGFHPWVLGKSRERINAFRNILKEIIQRDIIILTFDDYLEKIA